MFDGSSLFGGCVGPEKGRLVWFGCRLVIGGLAAETVQSTALAFQCVDDVHSGHCLSLGVFSVCDGVADDILQENLQYTTSFFIDETRYTLDTTSACKTTDGWLCDTLDIVAKYFTMTFCASLS